MKLKINFKKWVCSMMASLIAITTVSPAFAASPSSPNIQDLMVRGDARITRNDLGDTMLTISPGESSDRIFSMAGTTPMVWGRYYENGATGSIYVSYLQKDIQTGAVSFISKQLTPAMGQRFADGNGIVSNFKGQNPFSQFTGPGGTYAGISLNGFMAIAGMWAKHMSATKGFIVSGRSDYHGIYNWDECIKKVMKACVKKRFHQEAYSMLTPQWYVMGSTEVGEGHNFQAFYTSQSCLNAGGSNSECQVIGGVSFIKATSGSDFPVTPQRLWHHHEYKDGWAGWIIIAVTFLLTGDPGLAFFMGLLQNVATGVGPDDYNKGPYGSKVDGAASSQSTGAWSPIGCISGTQTSSGGQGGGRYGNNECSSIVTGDISNTQAGIGTFYNSKKQNPAFDYSLSNDVEVLRTLPEPPVRLNGDPPRF